MNTYTLDHHYETRDPTRRYKGIAVVIAVHLLIGWALISGTARESLKLVHKKMEAVLVEVDLPPPPPPPPPKPIQKPAEPAPAPDPFVPPPEVPLSTQESPVAIAASAEPPPAPAAIAAPEAAPVAVSRSDIAVLCPTQVRPEIPRKALLDGTTGMVRAQVLISGGLVRDVRILAGPKIFHAAVRAAMLQYKCTNEGEVSAIQEFNFKLE